LTGTLKNGYRHIRVNAIKSRIGEQATLNLAARNSMAKYGLYKVPTTRVGRRCMLYSEELRKAGCEKLHVRFDE
jgi:hypothetical protein